MMRLIHSRPQRPLPWRALLAAMAGLWLAPVGFGLAGLFLFYLVGRLAPEAGLFLWFGANVLLFSPLFSWIGWLIALPALALALRNGFFGWLNAAAIGAAAGGLAGALVENEIALPFGFVALPVLRALLGRMTLL